MSPSAVSRVERGEADRLSVRALARLTDRLGARLAVHLLWHGEELDRPLDASHSRLVEATVARLVTAGWSALPEVTFRVGPERGSIDVLAWHAASSHVLVVEVKSVVPDIQAMLSNLDRKARLAPTIARDQGWRADAVSRLLVLPEDRTARRRVATLPTTFSRTFPARNVEVRRWMVDPGRTISGVIFLSDVIHTGARHRIRAVSR